MRASVPPSPTTSRRSSRAAKSFMTTLQTVVQHLRRHHHAVRHPDNPGLTPKNSAKGRRPSSNGCSPRSTSPNGVLNKITSYFLPTTNIWTDPFGGLMAHRARR